MVYWINLQLFSNKIVINVCTKIVLNCTGWLFSLSNTIVLDYDIIINYVVNGSLYTTTTYLDLYAVQLFAK